MVHFTGSITPFGVGQKVPQNNVTNSAHNIYSVKHVFSASTQIGDLTHFAALFLSLAQVYYDAEHCYLTLE
jgi:hypothetical protein